MVKPQLASPPKSSGVSDWRSALILESREGRESGASPRGGEEKTSTEKKGGDDDQWAAALREVQVGVAIDEAEGPFARKLSSNLGAVTRPLIASQILPAPSNWGSMNEAELRAAVDSSRLSHKPPSPTLSNFPKVQVMDSMRFVLPEPSAADVGRIAAGLERAEAEERSEGLRTRSASLPRASETSSCDSPSLTSPRSSAPAALVVLQAALEKECANIKRLGETLGRDGGTLAVDSIADAAARCTKLAGAISALNESMRFIQ